MIYFFLVFVFYNKKCFKNEQNIEINVEIIFSKKIFKKKEIINKILFKCKI